MPSEIILALDLGEKRVGLAVADASVPVAVAQPTLETGSDLAERLLAEIQRLGATRLVVGLPRNLSGEQTRQSEFCLEFGQRLAKMSGLPLHFQDESLTSAQAEETLRLSGRPYRKGDVDALAAQLILNDFLGTWWSKNDGSE